MTRNFIIQYFFIGVYVAAAYNNRFYETPQNRELITNWVEEIPTQKKIPILSTNNDILDFIRTLDSLIERTASEIRSSLKTDNNINIGLIDSAYDNEENYNDINVNKFRARRQLEDELREVSTNPVTIKEDVEAKKTKTLENEIINTGYIPLGFPSSLFFPNSQNSTENKKTNENKPFLSFLERLNNNSFDDLSNEFNTSKNNFNSSEPTRKIRDIITSLPSSVIIPMKTLNITKESEIENRLGVVPAPSMNHEVVQESTRQAEKLQVVRNAELDNTVPSNEANKHEVRIPSNISTTTFDLFDDLVLQNRLKNNNHKNHLQEFGMKRVLENEDESKKLNTILQQMMNKNDEPVIESIPSYKTHDGSEKRKIYTAVTFVIIGGIIFVGFVTMLAFSLLKVRRDNLAGRVFVPPMTLVHE